MAGLVEVPELADEHGILRSLQPRLDEVERDNHNCIGNLNKAMSEVISLTTVRFAERLVKQIENEAGDDLDNQVAQLKEAEMAHTKMLPKIQSAPDTVTKTTSWH